MDKHYSKKQCIMIAALSVVGVKTKMGLTGVRSRVRESFEKRLI